MRASTRITHRLCGAVRFDYDLLTSIHDCSYIAFYHLFDSALARCRFGFLFAISISICFSVIYLRPSSSCSSCAHDSCMAAARDQKPRISIGSGTRIRASLKANVVDVFANGSACGCVGTQKMRVPVLYVTRRGGLLADASRLRNDAGGPEVWARRRSVAPHRAFGEP